MLDGGGREREARYPHYSIACAVKLMTCCHLRDGNMGRVGTFIYPPRCGGPEVLEAVYLDGGLSGE